MSQDPNDPAGNPAGNDPNPNPNDPAGNPAGNDPNPAPAGDLTGLPSDGGAGVSLNFEITWRLSHTNCEMKSKRSL